MIYALIAYLYLWGLYLLNDLFNPTSDERIGLFLWPVLPALWAPQIAWEKWGRKLYRRISK